MERMACLLLIAFLSACSSDYSPKPVGYPQIELETPAYILYDDNAGVEFKIPDNIQINTTADSLGGNTFSLFYPGLNAQIYCTYLSADSTMLGQIIDDNLGLLYVQLRRAGSFNENPYEDSINKVYGVVYSLEGNVAAPLHFYLTDNKNSFFRGELYFDKASNQDSIAPVLDYLSRDVQVLIESFRWKK